MADTKISALTAVASVTGTQEYAVNDAGTSKKATHAQLATYLGSPITTIISGADHSVANTTGTEVTELSATLTAGTWLIKYSLIVQTSLAGTGKSFGINYTGTMTRLVVQASYLGTGTAASTGIAQGDTVGANEALIEGFGTRTLSTTAPDLGPLTGFGTADVDSLFLIEGIIVVSNGGDIELWTASEAANATRVEIDSVAQFTKVA